MLDAAPTTRLDEDLRTRLGVYAAPDGSTLTLTGDNGSPRGLAYTLASGTHGALREEADGTFAAPDFTLRFGPVGGGTLMVSDARGVTVYSWVDLEQTFTTFPSGDIVLRGKLVRPRGPQARALAVWIEGSNNSPSTDDTIWQYALAARGVAVFVYDKRGTGASGGAPTSDFAVRADDTLAALAEARRIAPDIPRLGIIGGSQGGWVVPVAANRTRLDFTVHAFALADGPIAQDKALVEQAVSEGGFGPKALAQARKLTAITERIVRSNLAEGLDELELFKRVHADAPWLKAIQPKSYTGLFLSFTADQIRQSGPAAAQGLDFAFEPRPLIASNPARQLWLLGGNDRQAPNAETRAILGKLQESRRDIAVTIFPEAGHGLVQPAKDDRYGRMSYAPGLFDLTAKWIIDGKPPAQLADAHLPIIDGHAHIRLGDGDAITPTQPKGTEALRAIDERAGISRSALIVIAGGGPEAVRRKNDGVIAAAAADPAHFFPIASVHPADGDAAIAELDRVAALGVRIIKLHPSSQEFDVADPAVARITAHCGTLGLTVLFDSYDPFDPGQIGKFVKLTMSQPDTRFILAHMGFVRFRELGAFALLRKLGAPANVWFDISAVSVFYADNPAREELVATMRSIGMDRMIFGSDWPVDDPEATLRAVDKLALDPAEERLLLHDNMARLIDGA